MPGHIKLEVVGENPAEFANNLAGVVALSFGRVSGAVAAAQPIAEGETSQQRQARETGGDGDKPRRGRPSKAEKEAAAAAAAQTGQSDTAADDGEKVAEQPAVTVADVKTALIALLDKKGDDGEKVAEQPAVTAADVKTALIALLDKKGDEAPPKVLKEFGAAKISELKTEQFAAVIAAANKAAGE